MRCVYTRRNTIILCSLMPVFWLVAYSWLGDQYRVVEYSGRLFCTSKESKAHAYNMNYFIWTMLYLFVPALVILSLSIAIVVRLRHLNKADPLSKHRLACKSNSRFATVTTEFDNSTSECGNVPTEELPSSCSENGKDSKSVSKTQMPTHKHGIRWAYWYGKVYKSVTNSNIYL